MKKVALITCYFQHNFGSQLQAYATQWLFDNMQIENETVCIDGIRSEIKRAKLRYFTSRVFDIATVSDKLPTIRKKFAKLLIPTFRANDNLRADRFNSFARQMFRLSPIFTDKADIARNYDAFVVGSDQLWLPSNIEADYYTLNFVPDDKPKISIATSFGITKLPTRQARKAARFLPRFDALSVRESSGVEIVKSVAGRDATLLLDPTMLFTAEQWDTKLCKPRLVNKPYILCYFLGNNPAPRDFAKRLRAATGLPIVQPPHCDDFIAADNHLYDIPIFDADSFDMLRLIRNAQFVLTDSFHATAFALTYAKPFFSFRRYSGESTVSTNSRIVSLLNSVGLEWRILTGSEEISEVLSRQCDFSSLANHLSNMRQASYNWIYKNVLTLLL